MSPARVAVVTDIPTPYRDPLLSRFSRRPEVDLRVFYLARGEKDLWREPSWEMPPLHEFLPGHQWAWGGEDRLTLKWNPSLWGALQRFRPDLLVLGSWGQATSWIGMVWALLYGIPYALHCDSQLLDPRPMWKRALKQIVVRLAVAGQAAGLPAGTLARDCMVHYGADPETLFLCPPGPDASALADRARTLREGREDLRSRRGLDGRKVVLFVGRLVPVKAIDVLIRAAAKLRPRRPDLLIWIAGEGAERTALETLAEGCGAREVVRFEGFVRPEDLPELYVAADLFCLTSRREPWGVVVIEAMACGLPVVLSDRVGAGPDLLTPECGRIVPHDDPDALAGAIDEMLALPSGARSAAGETARGRALEWSYSLCLRSLDRLLQRCVTGGRGSRPAHVGPPTAPPRA